MKLYIKETGEARTIALKAWSDGQWSPDFFQDLETEYHDEETVTAEEFAHIVDYWEDEVRLHNNGCRSDNFGDPDDDFFNDDSLELFVN